MDNARFVARVAATIGWVVVGGGLLVALLVYLIFAANLMLALAATAGVALLTTVLAVIPFGLWAIIETLADIRDRGGRLT